MQVFTIYDLSTGLILRVGSCADDMVVHQVRPGEGLLLELADADQHFVRDGMLQLLPSKPAPWMTFDLATESWQDARTPEQIVVHLNSVKRAARQQIINALDDLGERVSGLVPRAEELSWPSKELAAQAWLSGNANAYQMSMLQAEAALTGETIGGLVAAIITNVPGFYEASGQIAGLRRTIVSAINTASDEQQVETALSIGMSVITTAMAAYN